jgi:hypothetical protein
LRRAEARQGVKIGVFPVGLPCQVRRERASPQGTRSRFTARDPIEGPWWYFHGWEGPRDRCAGWFRVLGGVLNRYFRAHLGSLSTRTTIPTRVNRHTKISLMSRPSLSGRSQHGVPCRSAECHFSGTGPLGFQHFSYDGETRRPFTPVLSSRQHLLYSCAGLRRVPCAFCDGAFH